MPANLPPQYFAAEKQFRQARDVQEKIDALELMLAIMPHHKGTDHLRAELRSRMAKLKQEEERQAATARRGSGYSIRKQGAGQVALAGLPNCGKSLLIAILTDAPAQEADYPFTTKEPLPAMMPFEDIQIQLIDLPPLTDRLAATWLGNLLRNADALLLFIDLGEEPEAQVEGILAELRRYRIESGLSRGPPAELLAVPKRVLLVANKSDLPHAARHLERLKRYVPPGTPILPISLVTGEGLEDLKLAIFKVLGVIRIYTKSPGQKPVMDQPAVLKRGSTIEDVAEDIHKELRSRLKYALVWGSAKHQGQRVRRDYQPEDRDIVELHA
jgi:ribosome-interacting GTPase 1